MLTTLSRLILVMTALFGLTAPAFAHTGLGDMHGFSHGFLHPISGLDHALAMVLVGVLAWRRAGRQTWLLPCLFVVAMAAGGAMALAGFAIPNVETIIALSVIVLGGMVLLNVGLAITLATAIVAISAVFHGFAHGAEMPATAEGITYAAGFMVATALLHAAGAAMAFLMGRSGSAFRRHVIRGVGGVSAVLGTGILLNVL